MNLIAKAMKQSGKTKFLVDGFPRNQDNMDGWNKVHRLSWLSIRLTAVAVLGHGQVGQRAPGPVL